MAFDPLKLIFGRRAARVDPSRVPMPGERRAIIQRLQVGFFGIGAMILLVGLANVIMNSVQQSQASTVPEAAPTVMASEEEAPSSSGDPLADAGVVPDLPAEPIKTPVPEITPLQGQSGGNGSPAPQN